MSLNNKLSSEAIQSFILASKDSLESIDQALKMNIAINNELNEKSMNQISQIIESSSGKDLSSTLLIQQLIQINAVVAAQKHTQRMNLLSITLKVIGVLLVIYLIYSLIAAIINWIGVILLVTIIGGLLLFGLSRS